MPWTEVQGEKMGAGSGTVCVGTDLTNVAPDRMGWRAKMDAMIERRKQKMVDRNASPIE